jgi:hypothetical protein
MKMTDLEERAFSLIASRYYINSDTFEQARKIASFVNAENKSINKNRVKTTGIEILEKGGKWLGIVHEQLIRYATSGEFLTWGSNDIVAGLTVHQIEKLVADAIATDRNERNDTI